MPQLLLFSIMKAFSAAFTREGDIEWLDDEVEYSKSHLKAPNAQLGFAIDAMIKMKVDKKLIMMFLE